MNDTVRRRRTLVMLLALLLIGAGLAGSPLVMEANRAVAGALRPLAFRWEWLNAIWIAGAVPVTFVVLAIGLGAIPRCRRHWQRVLVAGLAGSIIEVLLKHFVPLPMPPEVPAPAFWNHLSAAVNISPTTLTPLLHRLFPAARHANGPALFSGSYPSGHVFRTTFVAGALLPPRHRWPALVVAGTAAFMTVATGGHWAFDTVGGALLASAMWRVSGAASHSRKPSSRRQSPG